MITFACDIFQANVVAKQLFASKAFPASFRNKIDSYPYLAMTPSASHKPCNRNPSAAMRLRARWQTQMRWSGIIHGETPGKN